MTRRHRHLTSLASGPGLLRVGLPVATALARKRVKGPDRRLDDHERQRRGDRGGEMTSWSTVHALTLGRRQQFKVARLAAGTLLAASHQSCRRSRRRLRSGT